MSRKKVRSYIKDYLHNLDAVVDLFLLVFYDDIIYSNSFIRHRIFIIKNKFHRVQFDVLMRVFANSCMHATPNILYRLEYTSGVRKRRLINFPGGRAVYRVVIILTHFASCASIIYRHCVNNEKENL